MELVSQFNKFNEHYCQKYSGRKLKPIYSLGTAEIYFYPTQELEKKYAIQVSTYQLLILCALSNTAWRCTVRKIQEITGIPADQIILSLSALLKNKVGIKCYTIACLRKQ